MTVENLRTMVGRIVSGNPARAIPKKYQSGPMKGQPVIKDGKPVEQWFFAVAFPKQEFNTYLKPYFDQEAATAFPHGVPQNFSWKYKDGDTVDGTGKPYALREGWAGHIVVSISTEAFAPPIFKHVNGGYYQVAPEEIKTGDYVVVSLNLKVNVPTDRTFTPGLYVNPNGIELVGSGQAIVSAANPEEMFGGQQHQLPPGATPLGMAPPQQQPAPSGYPAQQPAPGYPQPQPAPAPQYAPQPQPAPQYQPQPMQQPAPAGYPPPATGFVDNAGNYQPQPQQPPQYQPQPMQPMQQQPAPGYPAQQPAPAGYPAQQPPGYMPPR